MTGKMRIRKITGLVLCIAVLLRVSVLAAQEPLFRLDMDTLNLQKGINANITVSLTNAQGAQILNIEGLENFDILSQSQSTSTSIINGDATYREDMYYIIMPKAVGQFTLKANIQYNGQAYETNTLQVTVSEASANEGEAARDLFVNTVLSHTEAYLGEKVVVSYELYTRYSIEGYGFTDYIAIDGVVAKDMPEDGLKAEYVYLDGNKYAKYEVKQMIIDPIKSGIYTIPSYNLQVNVTTESSMGGMGGFGSFFSSSRPMYLQTEEKELTVKPVPSEGRPQDYSGIVGELRLSGQYSRDRLNYGDSFTLSAEASGSCNLDGLKNIISGEMPGFKVFETQKNAMEAVENNQYRVQKEFEVIFVPERNGSLEAAPISISYFNPVTEKYEQATIPGVTVEVLGDMPQSYDAGGSLPGTVETVRIDRVSYAEESAEHFTIRLKKEAVYFVLAGLAGFLVIAGALLILISKRKKQDSTLKSLYKQLMASKDMNEIYNLFNDMIKHRYRLSIKACSQSVVRNGLPNADLAERVADVMDYMESPEARGEKGNDRLKEKIKSIYLSSCCHG